MPAAQLKKKKKEADLTKLEQVLECVLNKKSGNDSHVVGREAAQTPSFFKVFSSMLEATTRGGAQAKQAVSPGTRN